MTLTNLPNPTPDQPAGQEDAAPSTEQSVPYDAANRQILDTVVARNIPIGSTVEGEGLIGYTTFIEDPNDPNDTIFISHLVDGGVLVVLAEGQFILDKTLARVHDFPGLARTLARFVRSPEYQGLRQGNADTHQESQHLITASTVLPDTNRLIELRPPNAFPTISELDLHHGSAVRIVREMLHEATLEGKGLERKYRYQRRATRPYDADALRFIIEEISK